MMSEAKRYKFNSVPIVKMDGDWRRNSDYEALEQELKEAKDKVSLSRGALMIEGAIDRAEKAEQENKKQRELLELWDNYFGEMPLPTVNSYNLTTERIDDAKQYLVNMSEWRGDKPDELLQQLKGLNE